MDRSDLIIHRGTVIAWYLLLSVDGAAGGILTGALLDQRWSDTRLPVLALLISLALALGLRRLRKRRGLSPDNWSWKPKQGTRPEGVVLMDGRFALYGSRTSSPSEVRWDLEQSLDIDFQERESLYHGGTYYLWRPDPGGPEIKIQRNLEGAEGELAESGFPQSLTLVLTAELPQKTHARLADNDDLSLLEHRATR